MSKIMLTILIGMLVLGISTESGAADMGTAFTYQGRLSDGGAPAEGEYDLEFKLYDDPASGTQQGSTINIEDEQVSAGLFTVELDFGSDVFDGEARWLEIGVRPGDSTGAFTSLSPRQELTPTPYALYAQGGGGWVDDGAVVRLETLDDRVGIGTTSPSAKLHVAGDATGAGIHGISYDGSTGLPSTAAVAALNQASSGSGGPGLYASSNNFHAVLASNSNVNATIIGKNSGTGAALKGQTTGLGPVIQGWADTGDLLQLYSTPDLKFSIENDGNLMSEGGATFLGDVGIGTTNPNDKLTVEGTLSLDEMLSTPSVTSGYGKLYVKSSDSKLYFKDDTDTEYDLTAGGGGLSLPYSGSISTQYTAFSITNTHSSYESEGIEAESTGTGIRGLATGALGIYAYH